MFFGVWITCNGGKELHSNVSSMVFVLARVFICGTLLTNGQTKMVTFVSLGAFTQGSFGIQVPWVCRQWGL